ncbi:hypothetical protein [Paraflavitalea sp. CAU 1676]|uniref:hypothetical protein n=1 Tax=Paraflavitalea sp. CAU 1676 TaxID=3032598 RepID=UPI0023DC7917|nr:hypothetical protein [Paraflavitalea sp. CAU 1676]MDF2192087.1 hypothetical protein [Paraflavitalea sp. CAU 1676]
MKPLTYLAALLIVTVQGCKSTVSKPGPIEIALKSEGDTYSTNLSFFEQEGIVKNSGGLLGYEIKFDIGTITFRGREFEYPIMVQGTKSISSDAKIGCSLHLAPSIVLNNTDSTFQVKGDLSIDLISRTPVLTSENTTDLLNEDGSKPAEGDETFQIAFDSKYRKTVNTISLNFDVAVKYDSLNNIAGITLISKDAQYAKLGEGHYYLGRLNNKDEQSTKIYLRQLESGL